MKLPPISTPDSCWEASDHHRTGVEDEIVLDPWDPESTTESGKNIGLNNKEKVRRAGAEEGVSDSAPEEMSPSESDGPQDILASEDKTGTERTATVDDTVPMWEDKNALEKVREDIHCADVEPIELTDDGDWLDEDLLYETEDDGFEYSDSGDPAYKDSDSSFDDIPEFDEDAQQTPWEIKPEEEGQSIRRARDKAAYIASLLYLTSHDDQGTRCSSTYLHGRRLRPYGVASTAGLRCTHSSTFRAIKRIAISEGLSGPCCPLSGFLVIG